MTRKRRSNLLLALVCIAFALVLLFVWIPLDTDTGILEKARRRWVIGDALAPSVAALFILLGGLVLLAFERNDPDQPTLSAAQLVFMARVLLVIFVSLMVMRYLGPLVVEASNLFRDAPAEYRLLRDTAPWKYIGYFVGGSMLVTGLIAMIEGAMSWRALRIATIATLVLIAIYDLPFEDLLLPPNGDV